MKYHFIRDVLENREMNFDFVGTESMIADIMTKGLERLKHEKSRKAIGVTNENVMASMENDQGNTSNALDRQRVLEV